jgi:hypothetical protein
MIRQNGKTGQKNFNSQMDKKILILPSDKKILILPSQILPSDKKILILPSYCFIPIQIFLTIRPNLSVGPYSQLKKREQAQSQTIKSRIII